MKRFLSLILIFALLSISVCFAEEDTSYMFTATLTTQFDLSTEIWMSTENFRAMLAVLLMVDAQSDATYGDLIKEDIISMFLNSVYVGCDSVGSCHVIGMSEEKAFDIVFLPSLGFAALYSVDYSSIPFGLQDSTIKDLAEAMCEEYYYVSTRVLLDVGETIANILTDSE